MMKVNNKCVVFWISVLLSIALLSGCSVNQHNNETVKATEDNTPTFSIPETTKKGGYKIETNTLNCMVFVNNTYKYTTFQNDERLIEYYAGPTEMIIVDTYNGVTKCYHQTFEDIGQEYTNPLENMFKNLKTLDFKYKESNESQNVFEATKIVQSVNQQQIQYTCYTLDLDWINEKTYRFKYYSYEDGSFLISAEAPDEINPLLTKNTTWTVDINELAVKNNETNERVDLTIVEVSTGKALPPSGSNTEIVEHDQVISVYINSTTGEIELLQYVENKGNSENCIEIINDIDIVKPTITEDMIQMTPDELQMMLMLLTVIESIV